jgi:hypothetical protein
MPSSRSPAELRPRKIGSGWTRATFSWASTRRFTIKASDPELRTNGTYGDRTRLTRSTIELRRQSHHVPEGRPSGVEPEPTDPHSVVLPLHHGRYKSASEESNLGQPVIRRPHFHCARGGNCLGLETPSKDPSLSTAISNRRHSRGGGDRTRDLSVPNRTRYRCATPRNF